jgi:hypothetical protein
VTERTAFALRDVFQYPFDDVPASVLGMVGLVTAAQVLIRLTDELSTAVMGNFQDDMADLTAVVTSLSRLGGGVATAFRLSSCCWGWSPCWPA